MVNVVFIAYSACRSFSNFKNWIKSSQSENHKSLALEKLQTQLLNLFLLLLSQNRTSGILPDGIIYRRILMLKQHTLAQRNYTRRICKT
jgi:hypothetical protein